MASDKLTVQLALGAVLGGRTSDGKVDVTFRPGWLGGGSVAYQLLDGRGPRPFLVASLGVTTSDAFTEEEQLRHFRALDARVSVSVGKTFFGFLSPYAVVRAFGGP